MGFIDGAGTRKPWVNAGAPVDGTSGTLAGVAEAGDLLIDSTNTNLYQNTNTQASPTWTILSGTSGLGSLGSLTTDTQASAVAAINEVDANADSAQATADAAYVKPGAGIPSADMTAAVQTSLGLADSAQQPGEVGLVEGTPVNGVAAQGTLTISGVVIDGQTVTIGSDVYEFCADAAQSLTGGSDFAADIEASATKSQGTLTVDTQPTAGDTMTVGATTYTVVPAGTANAAGEIDRGADLAAAQVNIVAAINGTDGYNSANASASAAAFGGNASVITALIGGVAGDSIASTETFTAGTNVFDAATLGTTTAGVDCVAANAVTALVTSVTANDTAGVGAADGAGDTVVLTADTKGVAGNSIATTEAMANGAFDAATLGTTTAGVDGTTGDQWDILVDASYLYVAVAAQTIADANWRRITLGAAY